MATTRTNNSAADDTTKTQQEGQSKSTTTPRKTTTQSKTSAKAPTAKTKSTGTKSTGTKAKSTKAKSTTTTGAKSTKSGSSTSRASTAKSKAHENPIQAVKSTVSDAVSDLRHEVGRVEKGVERTWREEISVAGNELVDRIKELAADGSALRLIVKHDNRVIVEIPLAAAVVGSAITVVTAPILAAIAAIGGAVARVTLEVERKGEHPKAGSKK